MVLQRSASSVRRCAASLNRPRQSLFSVSHLRNDNTLDCVTLDYSVVHAIATPIEPTTCSLGSCRSTTELRMRWSRDEWRWGRAARVWCVSGCKVRSDCEIKNAPRVMCVEPQGHVCSRT